MSLLEYCNKNNIEITLPKIYDLPNIKYWNVLKDEIIENNIVPFGLEDITKITYNKLLELKKIKNKKKMYDKLSRFLFLQSEENENNFELSKNHWCYLDSKYGEWKIVLKDEWEKIYEDYRMRQFKKLLDREKILLILDNNPRYFREIEEKILAEASLKIKNTKNPV